MRNVMSTTLLAVLSITLSALAQLTLKWGMGAPNIQAAIRAETGMGPVLLGAGMSIGVILGLMLYGLSAVIWLLVLARWDLSKAYPFVGLGFVITLVLGVGVLGERVTLERGLGTLLVVCGVLLVSRT
jgi:multidrug transporter EmrE-like cation transporter